MKTVLLLAALVAIGDEHARAADGHDDVQRLRCDWPVLRTVSYGAGLRVRSAHRQRRRWQLCAAPGSCTPSTCLSDADCLSGKLCLDGGGAFGRSCCDGCSGF